MTQDNAPQGLLILIAAPSLEEMLVDLLLEQHAISGYTTSNASGRGTGHGEARLSLVEQVTGRQNRVQFMMHAALPDLHDLIAVLKDKFKTTDMHYILLPVLEAQAI